MATGDVQEAVIAEIDRRFASLRLAAPDQLARLRASIERDGVRTPLLVSTAVVPGLLVLVDGFKRIRILEDRNIHTVAVRLLPLDAPAAQVAMLHANAPHRGLSDLEEAWIVRSLCREHGLTQVAVARMLRRDKSWVSRRLRLAEHLESVIQEDIKLGLLSGAVARELSRLPRGNQVPVARSVREHGLTSRQAAALVTGVLGTEEPSARRDLLADPLRYLALQDSAAGNPSDPRLGVGGNEIRKALLTLDGSAERVIRMLMRHAPAGLRGEEARVLTGPLGHAVRAAEVAVKRLHQVASDSGIRVEPVDHNA